MEYRDVINAVNKMKPLGVADSAGWKRQTIFNRPGISIRTKILFSLMVVVLLMGMTNAILLIQMLNYTHQYDAIITNIATANSINGYIKPAIDTEMWNIVAGKTLFPDGHQYEIIDNVKAKIHWMMENTDSTESRMKMEIILRTLNTLTHYVDLMGEQTARKARVAENEIVLENIRGVSAVVEEVVSDYVLFEVNHAAERYREMHENFTRWEIFYLVLLAASVAFSVLAALKISSSIYNPIKKLHDATITVTKNDLQTLMTRENVDEITELGLSFNILTEKVRELLEGKIREQENLRKAELRALQAQINPHFLYNTLDTIIWMAESKKTDDVVKIVRALSNFFRISLSKGRDWITIREEIERTRSYLIIQKMRYADIMDYEIDLDDAVMDFTTLKLILQPLVENALYHGVKNKRNGGKICVRAKMNTQDEIVLEVEDNGIGFSEEKLALVQAQMKRESGVIRLENGYGLDNVNKRIQLYYGKQYGLSIESIHLAGTCVRVILPARKEYT